jgi:hypothetical protein
MYTNITVLKSTHQFQIQNNPFFSSNYYTGIAKYEDRSNKTCLGIVLDKGVYAIKIVLMGVETTSHCGTS